MSKLEQAARTALSALTMFSECDAFAVPFKPRTKAEQRWDEERMEEVYEAVDVAIIALQRALEKVEKT